MGELITAVAQPPILSSMNNVASSLNGSAQLDTLLAKAYLNQHDPTAERAAAAAVAVHNA